MELFSYGKMDAVFDTFNFCTERVKHLDGLFVTDKKLGIRYRAFRHKKSRKWGDSNNESMSMAVDTNLSPAFFFQYVDSQTGQSLTVSLKEVEQPSYGKTTLRMPIQYVDTQQRLFQRDALLVIETLPGTVAKRIAFYKQKFDAECQELLSKFLETGFRVNQNDVVNNMASYIHRWHLSHQVSLYDPNPAAQINEVLAVFSVLNEVQFRSLQAGNPCVWHEPFSNMKRDMDKLVPAWLPLEQIDALDRILYFKKNEPKLWEKLLDGARNNDCGSPRLSLSKLQEGLENITL